MRETPHSGGGARPHTTGLAALALIMAGASVATYLLWRRDPTVVLEHHLIEWTQAGLLLAACAVHGARARGRANGLDAVCHTGLALFCFSLAVRETDIERFGESPNWNIVEWVVRGFVVAVWVVFVISLRRRIGLLWSNRWAAALSMCAAYTAGGVGLYLVSYPFDKYMFPIDKGVAMLIEETVQLNACILFFAGAAATRAIVGEWVSG